MQEQRVLQEDGKRNCQGDMPAKHDAHESAEQEVGAGRTCRDVDQVDHEECSSQERDPGNLFVA